MCTCGVGVVDAGEALGRRVAHGTRARFAPPRAAPVSSNHHEARGLRLRATLRFQTGILSFAVYSTTFEGLCLEP